MEGNDLLKRSRLRMVEELRRKGIKDQRVLEAMARVPRHLFVPEGLSHKAYSDFPLPIGFGQTISGPSTVALMLEALELKGGEKVLEVGTGSGYQAALLAETGARVFSVERIPELAKRARVTLDRLGYGTVLIKIGDGSKGWPEEAPFDRILISASSPRLPMRLCEQLSLEGIMVLPLLLNGEERLMRIKRLKEGLLKEDLGPSRFVPLVGEEGWEEEKLKG